MSGVTKEFTTKRGTRWSFEINPDNTVWINLPDIKVRYLTEPLDINPVDEMGDDPVVWSQWASELLLDKGVVVYDEYEDALFTPEQHEELELERKWWEEHIRLESDPRKFI